MVHYKYSYFDGMGRGESARMVLALADQPFEDNRLRMESWGALKPTTPFGGCPTLEIDGKHTIAQTLAICRYIAEVHGFVGANPLENAIINMWVDFANELWTHMGKVVVYVIRDNDVPKSLAAAKEMLEGPWILFCDKLEAHLGKNCPGGWLVGNKPTWGDAYLGDWLNRVSIVEKTCIDKYPNIKAYYNRVIAIPSIAKHIATRPQCTR